jgi:DNA topoisomerase-3
MKDIAEMARHIVHQAKSHESDTVPGDFGTLSVPCPRCGGTVKETYKKFQCQSCDYSLWKIVAGRQFEIQEMESLLREKEVGPLQGFRNKMGRPFNAKVRLNEKLEPEFDFGQSREDEAAAEPVDFSGKEALGACPKCGSQVFEHGIAYVCEHAVGPAKSCDFRSGTIILQQPVEREQMKKLLSTGRTDLLRGFVSARTRRRFSAYLVRGGDGKVGFEFEAKTRKSAGQDDKSKALAAVKAKPAPIPTPRKRAAGK